VDPLLLDNEIQGKFQLYWLICICPNTSQFSKETHAPVLQDKMDSHERQLEILSKLEVKLFVTATFISPKKKTVRSKKTQVTMLDVGNDAACSPLKISPLSPLKLAQKSLTPLQRDDLGSGDESSDFSPNDASVASSSSYSPSKDFHSSDISDGNISEFSEFSSDSDEERVS